MSDSWDDFEANSPKLAAKPKKTTDKIGPEQPEQLTEASCEWGLDGQEAEDADEDSETSRFVPIYERFLDDKQAFLKPTAGCQKSYGASTLKALKEWFESEGHELSIKTDQVSGGQYVCQLELPIGDQDFSVKSEPQDKREEASEEACLFALRLLDECRLLHSNEQRDSELASTGKRRFEDTHKEDDIELDDTRKHCDNAKLANKVNTYESLMAKWGQLNMSILGLKAKLVKLDLSVSRGAGAESITEGERGNGDVEDEIDPLDAFMSNLESASKKSKLSFDEKIEKSRLRGQISAYEREQEELSRLISLAKPSFDLNSACKRR